MRAKIYPPSVMPDPSTSLRLPSGPRNKSGVTAWLGLAAMLLAIPAFADTPLPPARLAYTQLPDPHQEADLLIEPVAAV